MQNSVAAAGRRRSAYQNIPTLGSIIAAFPPVFLAFIHYGWQSSLFVLAAGYLAINMIMGNMVEPKVMGKRLGLSSPQPSAIAGRGLADPRHRGAEARTASPTRHTSWVSLLTDLSVACRDPSPLPDNHDHMNEDMPRLDGVGPTGDPLATDETELSPGARPDVLANFEGRRQRAAIQAALFGTQPRAPRHLGRFRLLEHLGAGGMGTVYAAYDEQLDRKIAIKIIHPRQRDTELRERTLREARALARLSHPNVVHVYDAGEDEEQLFVAMEFLAGPTLRAWIDGEARSWREILAVYREAGEGLAAAHASGIIHRDFKPHNTMFGADGRVRVLDFGLARLDLRSRDADETAALDEAGEDGLTMTGTIMGTPAYMAPEQFDGREVSALSDQFAFCVALFEALYGVRPFSGRRLDELRAALRSGAIEPRPRSTEVPREVHAVLLRGLALDPGQRWPSMRALLDALGDDPRLRRRRRLTLIGALGLLLGVGWGATRIVEPDSQACRGMERALSGVWDPARRAEVQAAIFATELSYAPATWERVERTLDDFAEGWVDARTEACEASRRGEQSGRLLDLRMACLDRRLSELRATVDVLAQADEAVVERAVSAAQSLPSLERCADVEALTAELPAPDDADVAARVRELEDRLASAAALRRAGKYVEGLATALDVAREAEELGYAPLIARAWLERGDLEGWTGEHEDSSNTLRRAYESALSQGMLPEAARAANMMLFCLGEGLSLHDEARAWAEHADPLSQVAGSESIRASYWHNLGVLALAQGEHVEAKTNFEAAIAIDERIQGTHELAMTLNSLGVTLGRMGEFEAARAQHQRALALVVELLGPEHPVVAGFTSNLANLAAVEGELDEAERLYGRTLVIQERVFGPQSLELARTLSNLGALAQKQGELEDAREHLERALAVRESALGSDHPGVASSLNNLGVLALGQGKLDDARAQLERVLAIRERAFEADHPQIASACYNLAKVAKAAGELDAARVYYERARDIYERKPGNEPALASTLISLGLLAKARGDYEQADADYTRGLEIMEARFGPGHEQLSLPLTNLASLALARGQYERSRDYSARALAIREASYAPDDPKIASTLTTLALASLELGELQEALTQLERALEIREAVDVDPGELADTQFALARALWRAPVDGGRARARAGELAEQAHAAYLRAGADAAREREAVERWLAER